MKYAIFWINTNAIEPKCRVAIDCETGRKITSFDKETLEQRAKEIQRKQKPGMKLWVSEYCD